MKNDDETVKAISNCISVLQELTKKLEQAQGPEKTLIQLEHNCVYQMSDGSVMQARKDVKKLWAMRDLKDCGEEWVATENGRIYDGKQTQAVEKIGKLAVVSNDSKRCETQTKLGEYTWDRAYDPESLTGKKL